MYRSKFSLTLLILISILFLGCESEEPLTVNQAILQSQRNGIDMLNQGEEEDETQDTVKEVFRATIKGTVVNFENIKLVENNLGVDIQAKNIVEEISFDLFNDLEKGDIDLGSILNKATYVDVTAQSFNAFSGTLTVDTLNSKLLTAKFFFSAAGSGDTIQIVDGFLRINRKP